MKNKYSFIQEGPWDIAARSVNSIARNGYINNAVRGAAVGSAVGAVGGMAKNALKRDDDPTKRGVIGSAFSGAAKGAAAGGVAGTAARFVTGRSFAKGGIAKLNHMGAMEATGGLKGKAAQNAYIARMRGYGNQARADGKGVLTTVDTGRHGNKFFNPWSHQKTTLNANPVTGQTQM